MAGGKLPRRGSRKDLLRQAEGTVSETITSTDALTRLREALPRQAPSRLPGHTLAAAVAVGWLAISPADHYG